MKRRYHMLTEDDVVAMRVLRARGIQYRELARIFDINHTTAWAACTGRTWPNVPNVQPCIRSERASEAGYSDLLILWMIAFAAALLALCLFDLLVVKA